MPEKNRLIIVKGKYLLRLIEEVNRRWPGAMKSSYWQKLTPDDRIVELASFFAMKSFSADDLRKIERAVFRIKIPIKLISICLLTLVIGLTIYKVYQFSVLPRVFAITNDVPVYEVINQSNKIVKHLDIFEESNSGSSTSKSMLLVKDAGSHYIVHDDSFIYWMMGDTRDYYVPKIAVTSRETEYKEYERIFKQANGITFFDQLTIDDRKAIKSCIDSNNEFFKAEVMVSKDTTNSYKSFISTNGQGNERHIFLCLKKYNSEISNINITSRGGSYVEHNEIISNTQKLFIVPLKWKEQQNKSGQYSIIYFLDTFSNKLYQSLYPPYEPFFEIP